MESFERTGRSRGIFKEPVFLKRQNNGYVPSLLRSAGAAWFGSAERALLLYRPLLRSFYDKILTNRVRVEYVGVLTLLIMGDE